MYKDAYIHAAVQCEHTQSMCTISAVLDDAH